MILIYQIAKINCGTIKPAEKDAHLKRMVEQLKDDKFSNTYVIQTQQESSISFITINTQTGVIRTLSQSAEYNIVDLECSQRIRLELMFKSILNNIKHIDNIQNSIEDLSYLLKKYYAANHSVI